MGNVIRMVLLASAGPRSVVESRTNEDPLPDARGSRIVAAM
jgi:hypothetical protein